MPGNWGKPLKTFNPRPWKIGNRLLGGERPLIMGILNVTPDSFHDGGRYNNADAALKRCETMLAGGADIIDVGGESTRPGSQGVCEKEEIDRTVPVIANIVKRFSIPVSIDTTKASVAERAAGAGASIVNDISGMTFDGEMAPVVARMGVSAVINHILGKPADMQHNPGYFDVLAEVAGFLAGRADHLASLGVARDKIAVDPGIGFGKRLQDNYRLIGEIECLEPIGCPVLLGLSRKSFFGNTRGLAGSSRLQPSLAAALFAALKGVCILRVHDVRETWEQLRIVDAVLGGE